MHAHLVKIGIYILICGGVNVRGCSKYRVYNKLSLPHAVHGHAAVDSIL